MFAGNTNNMGVKFNFLKSNPVSARYLQFIENTKPPGDYCLRIEIYARPQGNVYFHEGCCLFSLSHFYRVNTQ